MLFEANSWKYRVAGAGLALSLFAVGCNDTTTDATTTSSTATGDASVAVTADADVVSSIQLPQLELQGDVLEAVDGAILASVNGQRLLLPDTLAFEVDGETAVFADLIPGTAFTLDLPATSATVVALAPEVLTVQAPDLGFFQVPATLIPSNVLAQTRVQVQHENGNVVTVPLTAALNMMRSQPGARIVTNTNTLATLTPGTPGQAIFLGNLEDGEHLLLASVNGDLQLVRVDADLDADLEIGSPITFDWDGETIAFTPWAGGEDDGQDIELNVKRGDRNANGDMDDTDTDLDGDTDNTPPGQEIAPARPDSPPGQEADPGRGREDAPGQSIAPGQQESGDDTTSGLGEDAGRGNGNAGGNGNGNAGGNGRGNGRD